MIGDTKGKWFPKQDGFEQKMTLLRWLSHTRCSSNSSRKFTPLYICTSKGSVCKNTFQHRSGRDPFCRAGRLDTDYCSLQEPIHRRLPILCDVYYRIGGRLDYIEMMVLVRSSGEGDRVCRRFLARLWFPPSFSRSSRSIFLSLCSVQRCFNLLVKVWDSVELASVSCERMSSSASHSSSPTSLSIFEGPERPVRFEMSFWNSVVLEVIEPKAVGS